MNCSSIHSEIQVKKAEKGLHYINKTYQMIIYLSNLVPKHVVYIK